ncbi:hypothetical protein B0H14DRAFT_3435371 [Mycena olivaceomarginata]|nr:hypothetical protein B0H14DRAFT_3435371 [Mycena olivaceomarginata]
MLARSAPIFRLTQAMQLTVRARPDFALESESESASIAWTPLSSLRLSLRPHGELARTRVHTGLGAPHASLLPTRSRFAGAAVSDSATNEHTGDARVESVPSDGDDLAFADHALLERERPTTTSPECFDNNAPVITPPPPAGGVPRHVGMRNSRLYTLHDPGSALSVQAMPAAPNGISATISSVSIPALPRRCVGRRRDPRLATSTGVSFAVFGQGTPEEKLGMHFGGEDDEYLIAGRVAGTAGVVIYRRVDGARNLSEVARNTDIPTRTNVVWA